MSTEAEQQEVVDTLKGPRYYRVQLLGYGGESTYIGISKEAYDFWNEIIEEHGEDDLVEYISNAEDGDFEFDNIDNLPENADFMKDPDGGYFPWIEHHNEINHDFGGLYDSSYIVIEEVDSSEYNANFVSEIVDKEEISEFAERVAEEFNIDDTEIVHYSESEDYADTEYIAQFNSLEKGCFFDGIIETVGEFDPTQIKIFVTENIDGEEFISDVHYKNELIENNGGDTNGKGSSASVLKNF